MEILIIHMLLNIKVKRKDNRISLDEAESRAAPKTNRGFGIREKGSL